MRVLTPATFGIERGSFFGVHTIMQILRTDARLHQGFLAVWIVRTLARGGNIPRKRGRLGATTTRSNERANNAVSSMPALGSAKCGSTMASASSHIQRNIVLCNWRHTQMNRRIGCRQLVEAQFITPLSLLTAASQQSTIAGWPHVLFVLAPPATLLSEFSRVTGTTL